MWQFDSVPGHSRSLQFTLVFVGTAAWGGYSWYVLHPGDRRYGTIWYRPAGRGPGGEGQRTLWHTGPSASRFCTDRSALPVSPVQPKHRPAQRNPSFPGPDHEPETAWVDAIGLWARIEFGVSPAVSVVRVRDHAGAGATVSVADATGDTSAKRGTRSRAYCGVQGDGCGCRADGAAPGATPDASAAQRSRTSISTRARAMPRARQSPKLPASTGCDTRDAIGKQKSKTKTTKTRKRRNRVSEPRNQAASAVLGDAARDRKRQLECPTPADQMHRPEPGCGPFVRTDEICFTRIGHLITRRPAKKC